MRLFPFRAFPHTTLDRLRSCNGLAVVALLAGIGGAPCAIVGDIAYSRVQVISVQQGQTPSAPNAASVQEAEPPDEVPARIQPALDALRVADIGMLAKALGVEMAEKGEVEPNSPASSLTKLGDLDGDGISEVALKWFLPEPAGEDFQGEERARPSWRLYLLAWDGARWRASRLVGSAEGLQFQVIRLGRPTSGGIAVVTVNGDAAAPYPAVFQFKDHGATLVWDGQADESRFRTYDHGQIEFRGVAGQERTEMIVTGRADPGLLVFAKGGRRGFQARTVYRWEGQAYIPAETQYSANPDFTLYRFISALHLHNFKAAYALIDPREFLKTDSPTVEKFRQVVQDSWTEFLDDQVFEARETSLVMPDSYVFTLPEKHYEYRPKFGGDRRFLLTGLERREEQ